MLEYPAIPPGYPLSPLISQVDSDVHIPTETEIETSAFIGIYPGIDKLVLFTLRFLRQKNKFGLKLSKSKYYSHEDSDSYDYTSFFENQFSGR